MTALVTVDIGNSFVKFAFFPSERENIRSLPEPESVCVETTSTFSDLEHWLHSPTRRNIKLTWIISSVNDGRTRSLTHWLKRNRPWDTVRVLSLSDIPLVVLYDHPEQLGLDRAVAAYAAQTYFGRRGPIMVVDVGTATTIDLVDCQGRFAGGAIMPGPQISATALYEKTDRIPRLNLSHIAASRSWPATNTQDAIGVGITHGTAAAVFSFYLQALRKMQTEHADETLPILVTGRSEIVFEQLLSLLFDVLNDLFHNQTKPTIVTCSNVILRGLALLPLHNHDSNQE
ncbi:MAG: type III pantothenate kinase [Planctomycetia bacterium]|nr:type III pantothenate kinase [Planctomycetia bacterium]